MKYNYKSNIYITLLLLLILLLSSTSGGLPIVSLLWIGIPTLSDDLIISCIRLLYKRLLISVLGGGKGGGSGTRSLSLFTKSYYSKNV